MAQKTWFTGKSDSNLSKDAVIQKPDLFIAEFLHEVNAVWDDTAKTFTPTPASSFTIDEFISLGLKNCHVIDDNGVVSTVQIDDNDATTITIDETALFLESDGTTAASLTDTLTYQIRVLTPTIASEPFGKFFGYTEAMTLEINQEIAKFKESVPKKLRFQDLIEQEINLAGGNINLSNIDVLSTIFGAELFGLQAGQQSVSLGSNANISKFYRLVLNGKDRFGRGLTWIARRGQPESSGDVFGGSESGHFLANFKFSLIADGFYPDTADLLGIERAN